MKVVLKQQWDSLVNNDYVIYSKGIDILNVQSNLTTLPKFVKQIKSNFALIVIKNDQLLFAAVDHLANYPLYYSDNFITDNWNYVNSIKDEFISNQVIEKEVWLLGGQNLSDETCFNEVRRIKPNHYVYNNQPVQYRFLNNLMYSSDNIKDVLINKFLKLEQTDNTLMFSGGVDSVFLMNLVLKYGTKNWRFIHMYSSSDIHNETQAVEYFENYFNTKVEKYNIDNLHNLSAEQINTINRLESQTNFPNYWFHDELYGKFIMFQLANVKNELIWTGEVADQLFGNPKITALLPTWVQTQSYDAIADLWIDTTRSLVKSWICDVNKNFILRQKFNDPVEGDNWRTAYSNIKDQLIVYLKTSNIDDLIVKFTNFNYLIKGQLRVWPYSQLPEYNFANLFSHYDLVPMTFSLSSDQLAPESLFKGYLYNMFKDDLPVYAWQLPKTGPTHKIARLHNEIMSKF